MHRVNHRYLLSLPCMRRSRPVNTQPTGARWGIHGADRANGVDRIDGVDRTNGVDRSNGADRTNGIDAPP
jgi:hypothetical protein